MSRTMSIFLDALRFAAALAVVVGHFTVTPGLIGVPNLIDYAVAAVAVFFVLSGFVISHVVSTREHTPFEYALARLARLYSVMVPAIAFSCLVQWICSLLHPLEYAQAIAANYSGLVTTKHPDLRFLLRNVSPLTFLNMIHNREYVPDFNSPIWSLGFEAPYYALFGIAIFTRGRRRLVLLAISAAILGGGILRLLPTWLAGVALQRFLPTFKPARIWAIFIGSLSLVLVVAGCLLWHNFSVWARMPHSAALHFLLYGDGRAYKSYLFYYWATLTSLLLVAAQMLEVPLGLILVPLEKPIRWLAGHTFSIYLFHLPLGVLAVYAFPQSLASVRTAALIELVIVALCFPIAAITEAKKLWWRNLLHAAFARILPAKQVI